MRTIAVMNQKGGVGKTTTALNLAHAFARLGQRVLLLDLDPQGQAGMGLGVREAGQGMAAVLLDGAPLAQCTHAAREGLGLVPAGARLGELETMQGGAERGFLLRDALTRVQQTDIVLIDCPPASGLLTMNAVFAAGEMLIPVAADYLSLHGVSRLINVLTQIERQLRRTFVKHILLTRFHSRRRLSQDVAKTLAQYFPDALLGVHIREGVALAESPGFGKSIFEYRPKSPGAADYQALADELSARHQELRHVG